MDIDSLIQDITPLYNLYKANSRNISGTEALKIMWDIGDLIKQFLEEHSGIAPHKLYREIYGKSEGTENNVRKSYITREFLGRSFRIRNIFDTKQSIEDNLPNLERFTTFREAMPFFDNPKYFLKGAQMKELLKKLNSPNNRRAKKYVKELQDKYIDIENPRDQKLKELEGDKEIFVEFYNYVYLLLQKSKEEQKEELRSLEVTNKFFDHICQDTLALTEDRLVHSEKGVYKPLNNSKWDSYIELIEKYKSESNPKRIRRLRRIIPPMKMVNLSEMLHKLSLKGSLS
jgi:hypothetical protein